MPGFPSPSSGGRPERAPGGSAKSSQPGKVPYGGQTGGQVMISGPEEKALRVLELDNPDDPNDDMQLIQRASQESGLAPDRVQQLKQRAEAARNKGITLKGPTLTLQPINPQVEDGLLGADPMSDVAGMGPATQTPAGSVGAAAGAGRPAPGGGSIASGATMSSAGLGQQRYAPSWRPQMTQTGKQPSRMTPDVNSATGAATKPAGYSPAARPAAPRRPLSGGSAFGRSDARDPKLAAAYAREARVEECSRCGGTCKGRKKHRY